MFYCERHEKIIDLLRSRGHATVHYLAKELFVSEPTIRRDLFALSQSGRITRTFGGAVLSEMRTGEIPLELRERQATGAKEQIARMAKNYVRDGQVIFLDASSTVLRLIPYLSEFTGLTVITNGPKASLALAEAGIQSLCTGGVLLGKSKAFVGSYAEDFVGRFNADLFFFSCRGITEDGVLTDSSIEESELRRAMMRRSRQHIFLCTSDKIGQKYLCNLAAASEIDAILSDQPLPVGIARCLAERQ